MSDAIFNSSIVVVTHGRLLRGPKACLEHGSLRCDVDDCRDHHPLEALKGEGRNGRFKNKSVMGFARLKVHFLLRLFVDGLNYSVCPCLSSFLVFQLPNYYVQ